MAKGGEFERWVCDRLSCWWLGEKGHKPSRRVFWRSSGSGGTSRRANMRHHAGDVCHVDPCGAPFTDLIAVEVKRGYNRVSLQDLLDCPPGQKGGNGRGQNLPDWLDQAEEACERAGAYSWLLLVRRDGRRCLAVMPGPLAADFQRRGKALGVWSSAQGRTATATLDDGTVLYAVTFDDFLHCVRPDVIKALAKEV